MMRRKIVILVTVMMLAVVGACATVGGSLVGAGIGALGGDIVLGSAVGMTAGAVVDLFGN